MNLTPDQLKAWLTALRSGEFKQARKSLVYEGFTGKTTYCCMGVAGKVCLNLSNEKMSEGGLLSTIGKDVFFGGEEIALARLNDVHGLTFKQIAAFVEGADEETWKSLE